MYITSYCKPNSPALPKRARYYQSAIDRHTSEKGERYESLSDSFVIFICTFDMVGYGRAVYERVSGYKGCEGAGYEDGSHVFFLNSAYKIGNASKPILDYLDLVRTNSFVDAPTSELLAETQRAVASVRSDDSKEGPYMTYAMKMADERYAGLELGLKEGHEKGLKEGLEQGRKEGLEQGREEGRQETELKERVSFYHSLRDTTDWTEERILDTIRIPEGDREAFLKLVK